MNLWILLAITWISVSVVIADSRWFVQDPRLEEGDSDSADLFSSENLLPVKKKPSSTKKVKAKPQPPSKPKSQPVKVTTRTTTTTKPPQQRDSALGDVESEELLVVNAAGRKPLQVNKKVSKLDQKSSTKDNTVNIKPTEWFISDSSEESEGKDGLFPSELLMRVYKAKSKPVTAQKAGGVKASTVTTKPLNVKSKQNIAQPADPVLSVQPSIRKPLQFVESDSKVYAPSRKPSPNFQLTSSNLETWFNLAEKATTGKDELSEEHYIPVKPGAMKQPKQHTTTKQITKAKTKTEAKAQPVKTETKPKAGSAAVKKDFTPIEAGRRKPLQVVQDELSSTDIQTTNKPDEPCGAGTDVDCLIEDEQLIPVNKNTISRPIDVPAVKTEREKSNEREINRESLHRRLLHNGEDAHRVRRAAELADSEELMGLEELEDISEELLGGDDTPLRRFRRADNETEESGDGGFDGETDINNSTHLIDFQTIMNITRESLSAEDIANIRLEFARQTENNVNNFTGFQTVYVKNVTLDENGRVVVDWSLELATSAAPGNTQTERVQNTLDFITDTVTPFINNELTIEGQPVFEQLDGNVTRGIAANILQDPCQVRDACSQGYVCVSADSICMHLCYFNSFDQQCRHGSTCQLSDQFQPYCQCGSGYTGQFCETPVSDAEYSTGQVVGAGAAGAVAAAGAVGSIIYLVAYRRKKEEDMEYSYFGDDQAPAQAYSDPGSVLGVQTGFTIDRPSIIQPLDLYNETGAMA